MPLGKLSCPLSFQLIEFSFSGLFWAAPHLKKGAHRTANQGCTKKGGPWELAEVREPNFNQDLNKAFYQFLSPLHQAQRMTCDARR